MKNLKKVLAMVLAFACTFTMFASAKVYEDVQPGTEFSEAITMLSDLGIIQGKTDGKYHPEETITRAEACALIARLLTGDPNVSNFGGAQNFTDVVKGSWQDSAIGYCVANGITVGVGNGKFEPNRAINDQEFLTMMVRALGYETPDVKQGYPFSYMTVANAIGLRHNTEMMANTDALRGEDAQVIYNAMFVDYAKGAKLINTTHGTTMEQYPTLAESVWGLNRAAIGTWNKKDDEDVTLSNCKAHTWVIIGEAKDEEDALLAYPIDDDSTDLYKAEEKKHEYKTYKFKYAGDADALRGYQVELWGAGKHGDPVWEKEGDKFVYSEDWNIKAIKTVAGQTKYDYNSSMADKKDDNGEIVLNEETTVKLESVADNAKNVQHSDEVNEVVTFVGDKLNTVAIKGDKDVEKALNVRNGMQFKLMDWDSDGDIDWIVVDEARYFKVESASSKRVVVASMKGDDLKSNSGDAVETWKIDGTEKLSTNDAKKDVKIKYEVPEGLKEGDIVEVTYKVTFEDKAQLITATATVVDADNQKLEKVGTKDGLTLTFGDEEVKVAQNAKVGDVIVPANPQTYKDFNGEELGTEFALYKNRNGFIVYSDYATESSNYMMVLNTYGGKDSTGNRDLAVIDFVDANNQEHKDVKVSSSVRVLDKKGDTLQSKGVDAYGENDTRKFDEAQVVGNVFKYWTNEDGVITKMQAVFDADDAKAEAGKEGYTYKADADRLIDKNNKYVASLEDANVIFAVKEDYIKADNNSGVFATDLKVSASDVLATKQKDVPNIGTGEDTKNKALLLNTVPDKDTWLGKKSENKNHFAVALNKNEEATAAVLGVSDFNKFNAGQTKLALVTNVSENSKGVIEAEVAYNGEVTTLASAEKQDFDGIVKVFDGTDDNDVSRADSKITTKNGNGIFDGGKLSEIVNEGGQYAEVTTDADGKLTKLVFMDDDATNKNLLKGHYYEVSRNLVLDVKDNNLKYALNDNKRYYDVVADQRFADSDNLFSTGRLEADSKGYASDAKFYEIDATPSRHDKDYSGSRLTVNAGFDNLDQRDIKAVEKSDIGYNSPDYRADKNHYEISDLAYKIDGDLVAVYSFKSMDETDARKTLVGMDLDKTEAAANTTINLKASVLHTEEGAKITGFKVFDSKGNDVSAKFNPQITAGAFTTDAEGTLTVPSGILNGEYTVKAAGANGVYDAGRKIVVSDSVQKLVVDSVKFAKPAGTSYTADNKFYAVDKYSFVLEVKAGAYDIAGMEASNLKVTLDGQSKTVTGVQYKGNGFYVVSVADVDFNTTPDNNKQIAVELVANSNLNLPTAGLSALVTQTNGNSVATGGTENAGGGTQAPSTITGVGNVAKAENVTGTIDTVNEVKNISVELKAANETTVVTGLQAKDFTAKVGTSADKMEDVTLSDGAGRALTATVKENATKGKYDFTFAEDLRGKTVEITVNGQTVTVKVDAAKVVVSVAPETLEVTQGSAATGTATVTLQNADKSNLKIWLEGQKYADGKADATDTTTGVKATLSDVTVTLSEQVNATGTVKFVVGVSDEATATLTVNVVAAKPSINLGSQGAMTIDALTADAAAEKEITATIDNADGNTLVISHEAIKADTSTTTTQAVNGLTAKIEGDKIKVTGTPTKAGATEFHVGMRKGTTTDVATVAKVTVTVEKVKASELTVEATLSNGTGGTKNKDITFILKKDNTPLTKAQMTALGLDTTASKYTVTNDDSKTVETVKVEEGKIVISLDAALTTSKKITKIATTATDFAEAFEYNTQIDAHA